ncbi:MAG TPA: SRPBCC family protein, partial [Chloroflexota bacterium]
RMPRCVNGGERSTMPTIQENIDIRAPIDKVFAALIDPRRGPEWNPNLVRVEDVEAGPARAGTEWRQTTMVAGRPINLNCRVTKLDAPKFGVLEVTGDHQGSVTTMCEERDGMTRVTQTLQYNLPRGMFGQMAGGFIANALRREMVRTMDRQRTILERENASSDRSPDT